MRSARPCSSNVRRRFGSTRPSCKCASALSTLAVSENGETEIGERHEKVFAEAHKCGGAGAVRG